MEATSARQSHDLVGEQRELDIQTRTSQLEELSSHANRGRRRSGYAAQVCAGIAPIGPSLTNELMPPASPGDT